MNQINQQVYEFSNFRLEVSKRTLLRDGAVVPLAPKAFDVLVILVEHHGEVLEKDRLMTMLWPDSIVEEANLPQNISALRKALGESPNKRRYIVTIPGRGYRFAADVVSSDGENQSLLVEEYTKSALIIQEKDQEQKDEPKAKGWLDEFVFFRNRPQWLIISLAFTVVALSVVAIYFLSQKTPSRNAAIQSLAILPFINTSADANVEYLSDGIAESLINSLSQLSKLKVIARTTAFRYKGKETDAQAIGRDLHVDAIITGRVTQQGDTLIVQADLLSAADGTQV